MKRLIGPAAALLALGASATGAAAASPTAWVLKADFAKAHYTFLCFTSVDDGRISGPCVSVQGKVLATSGRWSGDRLDFKYSTDYNGSGIEQDYTGVKQADGDVSGKVSNRLGNGLFTGTPFIQPQAGDPMTAWKMSVAFTSDIRFVVLCAFPTKAASFRGPCAVTQGGVLQTSGTTDGSKVEFAYDVEMNGKPVHVAYTGEMKGDGSVAGTVKADDATGTFTAKPQP